MGNITKRELPPETKKRLADSQLLYLRRKLQIRTIEYNGISDEELSRLYYALKLELEWRMWRIVMPISLAIALALALMFIKF